MCDFFLRACLECIYAMANLPLHYLLRHYILHLESGSKVRWVLDQPAVGGAIVGVRLGLTEHLEDNKKVFSFKLDNDDVSAIAAVQGKSKDLMTVFGDCGGEYRFRIRS